MRAARFHRYGDPDALVVEEALPLASIREAHELAENGAGKIVMTLT
jgi:hypothetical protein